MEVAAVPPFSPTEETPVPAQDLPGGHPRLLNVLTREMRLRNYSPKTIKAYRSCIRSLIRYFHPRHPRELTEADLKDYLVFLLVKQEHAASTVNQAYNALRFLYIDLYHQPLVIRDLPRPQKDRKAEVGALHSLNAPLSYRK